MAFDSMPSSSEASCVSFDELLRGNLIHRRLGEDVGVGDELERHAGQERAGRARVVAAALDLVGGLVGEPAEQQHLILEGAAATAASAAARRAALRSSGNQYAIDMPLGT